MFFLCCFSLSLLFLHVFCTYARQGPSKEATQSSPTTISRCSNSTYFYLFGAPCRFRLWVSKRKAPWPTRTTPGTTQTTPGTIQTAPRTTRTNSRTARTTSGTTRSVGTRNPRTFSQENPSNLANPSVHQTLRSLQGGRRHRAPALNIYIYIYIYI